MKLVYSVGWQMRIQVRWENYGNEKKVYYAYIVPDVSSRSVFFGKRRDRGTAGAECRKCRADRRYRAGGREGAGKISGEAECHKSVSLQ
jgi:hypothetical protein